MPGQSCSLSTRRTLWRVLGFFCCVLITFSGVVQLAHAHADGQAIQSDCSLCHTAHLVVQPSVPQALPRLVFVVASISAALQPIRARVFFAFSLFTRPPPEQTARS